MLLELLKDHQTGHTEFQDDYFITRRSGGSLYGQYVQALRELYKRFRGLRQLYANSERLNVDIEELEWKLKEECYENKFEKRRMEIDLSEKKLSVEEATRAKKDTEREFKRFYQQASWLKNQIGEIDDKRRQELDRESWMYWIREKAALDLMTNRALSEGAIQMIHSAPSDMRNKILNEIKNGKVIEWFQNQNDKIELPVDLPNVELPSPEDILALSD